MFFTVAVASYGLMTYILRILLQLYILKFTVSDLSDFEKAHHIPNYQRPALHTLQGIAIGGLLAMILIIFFRGVELWRAIEENRTYDDFVRERMLSEFTPIFLAAYLIFDAYLAYGFWTLSKDLPLGLVPLICRYLFYGLVGLLFLIVAGEVLVYIAVCLCGFYDAHQGHNQDGQDVELGPVNQPVNAQPPPINPPAPVAQLP
ncbi:hypothetical protein GGR57DRAFT_505056 [Xylariaceae sp. FL1272]|nr:hypothetical protein GGR57DRAFT_505056 [Xylariaceae sp. FL1272]